MKGGQRNPDAATAHLGPGGATERCATRCCVPCACAAAVLAAGGAFRTGCAEGQGALSSPCQLSRSECPRALLSTCGRRRVQLADPLGLRALPLPEDTAHEQHGLAHAPLRRQARDGRRPRQHVDRSQGLCCVGEQRGHDFSHSAPEAPVPTEGKQVRAASDTPQALGLLRSSIT